MGIAEAAETQNSDKPSPVPYEVKISNAIGKWGNPYGPWTEWAAGTMYRYQTAMAIWDIYYGGTDVKPGGFSEWAEKNPGKVRTYIMIERMRDG